eukprot:9230332-Pyramimonas_sp.AAC.1
MRGLRGGRRRTGRAREEEGLDRVEEEQTLEVDEKVEEENKEEETTRMMGDDDDDAADDDEDDDDGESGDHGACDSG